MCFPEGQVPVFLYGQLVNMRLSFDVLYALAKHVMHQDPLFRNLFALLNRRAAQIRVCTPPGSVFAYGLSVSSKVGFSATGLMSQAAKWTGRASNCCSVGSNRNRCASATKKPVIGTQNHPAHPANIL
ncbi:transposase [Massilia atriviolacea]|uniref:Uncharacterized protein n=1 Tax=Massilia atriviolacea TaxID=2495579 RepID=A0A430HSH5_9BURK|nr:hypothetical protein EJB06_05135 [Massilia atriviolacea]